MSDAVTIENLMRALDALRVERDEARAAADTARQKYDELWAAHDELLRKALDFTDWNARVAAEAEVVVLREALTKVATMTWRGDGVLLDDIRRHAEAALARVAEDAPTTVPQRNGVWPNNGEENLTTARVAGSSLTPEATDG